METASGRLALPRSVRSEKVPGALPLVFLYGSLLTAAEVIASYLPGPDGRYPSADGVVLGMTLHSIVLMLLLGHAAYLYSHKSQALGGFLLAMVAIPLIRIFSLSLPFFHFTIVQWLLIISAPLLLTFASLVKVLGIKPASVGLRMLGLWDLPFQGAVAASGLLLGLVEYQILRPSQPWIPQMTPSFLIVGSLAVTLSSGLAEELIFRGILLREGLGILGSWGALLAVTSLFAAMHVGFLSALDMAFVFLVGLYFGFVVLKTSCIYGVIACHALANIVLYMVAPFALGSIA